MSILSKPANSVVQLGRDLGGRILQKPRVALALTTAVALGARMIGISSRPIWYDEAFAVLFAEKGPAAMVVGTLAQVGSAASDVHPLGYYVILWGWMRAFGESLVSGRSLSIIAGLGSVMLIYLLAKELFGAGPALAAGLIVALAPFQVHYAQEIRMYGFMCLWLLLATYCFLRGSRSMRWRWWLGFSIASALAIWTQYLAAFYLAPLALWPLFARNWRVVTRVLLAGTVSVLICLPWLIHLPAQFSKVHQVYWIAKPEPYRLLTLLLVFVSNLPLPGWQLSVGLFVALSIVAIASLQTIRAGRSGVPGFDNLLLLVYLTFVPPVLMFALSQWIPVYLERALLTSGATFCVWLAWFFTVAQPPRSIAWLSLVLLAVGFSLGLYQHATYAGFPYAPFRALDADLAARFEPGDAIVHSSKLSLVPAMYFDRTLPATYIADPPGSAVDTLAPQTQEVIGVQSMTDITSAVGTASRIWYILFDESNLEYVRAGYPRHPDLTWLMQRYRLVEVDHWNTLGVYLFAKVR